MNKTMRLFPSRSFPALPRASSALTLLLLLGGCAVGPTYERPSAPTSASFKELPPGWVQAAPSDAIDRGEWWKLFNDPTLDDLESQVIVSNQNIAVAAASYEQARAIVQQQRAAIFPVVSLDGSATREGGNGLSSRLSTSSTTRSSSSGSSRTNMQLSLGASWEPDVWGRLRAGLTGAQASAQASEADLASARLSAQGEVAVDYFSLRQADAQIELLKSTVEGYQRSLDITRNRYNAAIAAKTDVLQAETQLASAQVDLLTTQQQRAQLEHAIAVLVGKAPSEFTLEPAKWNVTIPEVPVGVPSTLLQRRPDIAAAERRVAAANADIGIAKAGYFPSFGLNASYGTSGGSMGDLLSASNAIWSLGLSVAQTVLDFGATSGKVDAARAAYNGTVANYRQTVLTAFQSVEDQLTAAQILARQQEYRKQASEAADQVEAQMLNRYRAGQVSYTDVVTAQATALNARRSLVQAQADRQTAAISLIQALGGGWKVPNEE
jgi:NodT family efflux transporter outer membrane factor (OMF) lipoprotein